MEKESEYLGTLKRAFIDVRADFVQVDGWTNAYIRGCTDWALKQNLLRYDEDTSKRNSDSQYTALCYRLTDEGRARLESLAAVAT